MTVWMCREIEIFYIFGTGWLPLTVIFTPSLAILVYFVRDTNSWELKWLPLAPIFTKGNWRVWRKQWRVLIHSETVIEPFDQPEIALRSLSIAFHAASQAQDYQWWGEDSSVLKIENPQQEMMDGCDRCRIWAGHRLRSDRHKQDSEIFSWTDGSV